MQLEISGVSLNEIIEIRMKDLGETREEAEKLVKWIDKNCDQSTMRKSFRKMIEDGTIF